MTKEKIRIPTPINSFSRAFYLVVLWLFAVVGFVYILSEVIKWLS